MPRYYLTTQNLCKRWVYPPKYQMLRRKSGRKKGSLLYTRKQHDMTEYEAEPTINFSRPQ